MAGAAPLHRPSSILYRPSSPQSSVLSPQSSVLRPRSRKRVRFQGGAEGAEHPVRAAEAVGRDLRGRARERQPLLVDLVRALGIDVDVAVAVVRAGALQAHFLVPAVHAAY